MLVVNKSDLTNDASTRRHTSIIGYRFAIPFFRCHLSRHCQLSRCAQRRSIVIWSKEPRFDAPSENKFILCPQTLSFHRHPVIQVKIHTTYALRYIQKAKSTRACAYVYLQRIPFGRKVNSINNCYIFLVVLSKQTDSGLFLRQEKTRFRGSNIFEQIWAIISTKSLDGFIFIPVLQFSFHISLYIYYFT